MQLTGPARAVATALSAAVTGARGRDLGAWTAALSDLGRCDPGQVRRVLAEIVRPLLEDLHPDGVGGDDLADVLAGCTRDAALWFPAVDPLVLTVVLTGAFEAHDDETTQGEGDELGTAIRPGVQSHAVIVVAYLLSSAGLPLEPYLEAAFAEIWRADTTEGP